MSTQSVVGKVSGPRRFECDASCSQTFNLCFEGLSARHLSIPHRRAVPWNGAEEARRFRSRRCLGGESVTDLPNDLENDFDLFLTRVEACDDTGGQVAQVRRALERLCAKGERMNRGFVRRKLASRLNMLLRFQDLTRRGRIWDDPLRFGESPKQRFSKNRLRRIAALARKLQEEVKDLLLTGLIFETRIEGRIPKSDVLRSQLPHASLNTLVELPELAKAYGTGGYPHSVTDGQLWLLCKYIKETTMGWNDSLVVDLLEPLGMKHCASVDTLKNWRSRVAQEVTPKAPK
jgi:hypothetical protein